ncbi:MAG TPA: thioesterase family protein [Planctomycetota bacterium]|nr:thioesterase family protein [Planctomycetota bacterium]
MEPPVRNPFVLRFTVTADDIDELDHVSNVRIVHWMNRAAVEHSTSLGFDVKRYRELGGVFVVRRHEIDYLASARKGDELVAFTWPTVFQRSSAERRHEIRRVSDDRVIARGFNLWAYVDFTTGRPTRIPPVLLEAFDPARFV